MQQRGCSVVTSLAVKGLALAVPALQGKLHKNKEVGGLRRRRVARVPLRFGENAQPRYPPGR
jgi:hypothetical protein